MIVRVKFSALKQSHWYEYLIRFVLGGLATVVAGVIAKASGPATGGLFLALPAIFCASATLIEKHERARKEKRGLRGTRRGKQAAALDAAGAALGSFGLMVFAATVWLLAPMGPWTTLIVASAAWLIVATGLWWLRGKLRLTSMRGKFRHSAG